jgi:hypothetical protein
MDIFTSVLVSVITSSVVVGLMVFVVKKYVGEAIAYEFKRRGEDEALMRQREIKRTEELFKSQLGIFPEIAEVTYRLKVILTDEKKMVYAYEWNQELMPLCGHMTEMLFRYRLYLPDALFDKLHDLKRLGQDAMVIADVCSRGDNPFETERFAQEMARIALNAERVERLYAEVIAGLKAIAGDI